MRYGEDVYTFPIEVDGAIFESRDRQVINFAEANPRRLYGAVNEHERDMRRRTGIG